MVLRNGQKVVVTGAQIPGGRINVFYPAEGRTVVAADPGDYIYPSDVRIDNRKDLLYIKAYGMAGGISEQTWLFQYDIRRQQIIKARQVKNDILTGDCPGS